MHGVRNAFPDLAMLACHIAVASLSGWFYCQSHRMLSEQLLLSVSKIERSVIKRCVFVAIHPPVNCSFMDAPRPWLFQNVPPS